MQTRTDTDTEALFLQLIDSEIRAEAAVGEEVNPEDGEGFTRLHYASRWGALDRISDLIARGAGRWLFIHIIVNLCHA